MSLKAQKEAFVTGHTGTTASEILLVCISSPIGILLFHELRHHCRVSKYFSSNEEELPFVILIAMEMITILLPMSLCETELLNPYGVIILSFELLLGMGLLVNRRCVVNEKDQPPVPRFSSLPSNISPPSSPAKNMTNTAVEYLTFYRSTVSYLTFVAILAVDFPIFPRSFAKTEVYGYGLMDIGAGSFCAIGGLVSWFARSGQNIIHNDDYMNKKMKKVMINIIPLLIMGFIRFITTKGLEYQEHVSEYGVHWNFFFTLAFVNAGATFLRSCKSELRLPFVTWIPLLVMYQVALSMNNLQHYIVEAPRFCKASESYLCHFFAANREGILGCIGYLIIFLACEDVGKYCIWSCRTEYPTKQGTRILICASFFWVSHWVLSSTSLLGIVVSRRSTNATFILWTIAHNLTLLFLIWAPFHFCSGSSVSDPSTKTISYHVINPPIFHAVNKHGLIVFILANLMTGAVNLTMNTMEASSGQAIFVILCYLCSVGAVALIVSHILDNRLNESNKRL